jgi:outer membrane protein assembly factor BamB
MKSRLAVSSLVLFTAVAGCSDTTGPVSDPTQPQSVSLGPPTTVPLLAAFDERVYTLRGVDGSTVDVEARRLNGSSKWKINITSCGTFCFLAVDGSDNVYFTTALDVTSVVGSSGKERWKAAVRGAVIALGSNNRIYVASRPFAVPQRTYAIDATNGQIIWSATLLPKVDATALLVDESRGFVYAIGRGLVSTINILNGAVLRTTKDDCFGGSQGAIASDGTIYATCDNLGSSRLTAFEPGGFIRWSTVLSNANGSSAPVIDASGTIYVSNRSSLTALNPDGTILWQLGELTDNLVSPAVGSNKDVYIHATHPSSPVASLLVVNNGAIVENKGPMNCAHSFLLMPTGRIYCASSGGFSFFQTSNTDVTSQWSQLGNDAQRGSRKR